MSLRKVLSTFIITIAFAVAIAAQTDIHAVDFMNFTYSAHCAGESLIRLPVKNSEYSRKRQMKDYIDRLYFKIFEVSYGDLTGDGRDESIVLSTCNTGGSGNFSEGFIYGMKAGKAALVSRFPGGDRAYGGLRTARVENGLLVLEVNDPGEDGASCCPELKITSRYKMSPSGKLVEQGKSVTEALYPEERVTFARGTSGTTIRVKLDADDRKRYVVGARAGQTLTVASDNRDAALHLRSDIEVVESENKLTAKLPTTANYTIEVQNISDKPITAVISIKIN